MYEDDLIDFGKARLAEYLNVDGAIFLNECKHRVHTVNVIVGALHLYMQKTFLLTVTSTLTVDTKDTVPVIQGTLVLNAC